MSEERLRGKSIVITRGEGQEGPLREALESLGAEVLHVPAIRFTPPEDLREWQQALDDRELFTHIVFTSAVAADWFARLSEQAGLARDAWDGCRVGAIGPRTADALRVSGREPHITASSSNGLEFARELLEHERLGPDSRVLLPQSDIGRPELADHLEAAGIAVMRASVYATVSEEPEKATPLLRALDSGRRMDAILFASPSALRGFTEMTGNRGEAALLSGSTRIVAIGPTTSAAIEEAGFRVDATATRPGVDGMVEAVSTALA